LEAVAIDVVQRYDAFALPSPASAEAAVKAASAAQPDEHDAAVIVIEFRQLAARPIPSGACTFSAAAADVLARALAEVAVHVHSRSSP
jgi:hypothetical protein